MIIAIKIFYFCIKFCGRLPILLIQANSGVVMKLDLTITDDSGITYTLSAEDVGEQDKEALALKIARFVKATLDIPTGFKVELSEVKLDHNNSRIPAIKALRTVTGLGLKEAKDVVDSVSANPERVYALSNLFATHQKQTVLNLLSPHFVVVKVLDLQ